MVGESGVGGRAGEAFFQVFGCFQARARTAFKTDGWGRSHAPHQHMGDGRYSFVERQPQDFEDLRWNWGRSTKKRMLLCANDTSLDRSAALRLCL
jgi:hypothetical protein